MVGTGARSPRLVEAHATGRPIRNVLICGRDPANAKRPAQRLARKALKVAAPAALPAGGRRCRPPADVAPPGGPRIAPRPAREDAGSHVQAPPTVVARGAGRTRSPSPVHWIASPPVRDNADAQMVAAPLPA